MENKTAALMVGEGYCELLLGCEGFYFTYTWSKKIKRA